MKGMDAKPDKLVIKELEARIAGLEVQLKAADALEVYAKRVAVKIASGGNDFDSHELWLLADKYRAAREGLT